ncbi:MAG TPA: HD domain-containing protein, partial [Rhodothermales bacterium]|nr:HD domain-containing protein [Rhodothermales bacterium]
PKGLVLDLVGSDAFQRLRRIRQLGLGFLVFPSAVHTRFEHALGAMALMQEALLTLQEKGTVMTTDEVEGALAAALLHDVGHGPFSHTLEDVLLPPGPDGRPFHHEAMSRALMERLNDRRGGGLEVALAIFDGAYDRPFFHALVSSQLDMDRLDYLRRDSFYTGVAEGVVGVERILKTLRVHPAPGGPGARIVVEAKGAYAVENFLLSRRLMYGQVYLHKTVLAADHLLLSIVARARTLRTLGVADPALDGASPALLYFLDGRATADVLDRPPGDAEREAALDHYVALDDSDVLYSIKRWASAADPILADLARRFLLRRLPRTRYVTGPVTDADRAGYLAQTAAWLVKEGLATPQTSKDDARYYVADGVARLDAYRSRGDVICIIGDDGQLRELSEASELMALGADPIEKPYVVLPKEVAPPRS